MDDPSPGPSTRSPNSCFPDSESSGDEFGSAELEDAQTALADMRRDIMHTSDEESRKNTEDFTNRLAVNRESYMDTCIILAISEEFQQKVRFPLVVNFVGEDGFDNGGLRDEFLSLVLQSIEETIKVVLGMLHQFREGMLLPTLFW